MSQTMSSQIRLVYIYICCYCCYFSEASVEVEIKDISNTTSSCHPLDSCEPLPAEGPVAGHNRTCRCDRLCVVYGDCCRDAEVYDAETQRHIAQAHRCMNLIEYDNIYIRTQCQEGWQDDLGKELCDRAQVGFIRQNVALDLPVTSLQTGITYANIHCAICNDDIGNLTRWQPRLECGDLPQNYPRKEVKKNLYYRTEREAWELILISGEGHFGSKTCEVLPEAPKSVIGLLRPCERTEASCSANWTDPHTQELCLNHMARVYAGNGDSYRNRFCAICNYIKESDTTCEEPVFDLLRAFGFTLGRFATNGFSTLLDWDTLFEENLPIETKIFVKTENGPVEHFENKLDSYSTGLTEIADLPEKTHGQINSNTSCHPLDSCEPLPAGGQETGHSRTCRCDSLCAVYGDCCMDAEEYKANIQSRNVLAHSCVSLVEYNNIYIRGQCRDGWQGEREIELCNRAEVKYIRKNISLDLPITSLHTGITYANIYCAICNEDISSLSRWLPRLECNELPQNYPKEEVRKNLHYSNEIQTWVITLNREVEYDIEVTCVMNPEAPESVKALLRPCEITKAYCAANWTDSHTQQLCLNHMARVYTGTGESYRNRFCAICDNIKENHITCEKPLSVGYRSFDFDIARFATNGYSTLLNWATLFEENLPTEKVTNGSVERIDKNRDSYTVVVSKLPDLLGNSNVSEVEECISLKNGNKLCRMKELDNSTVILSIVSFSCLLLSSVCLIIHLIVFFIVPDLKNLSGKNLASYSIALLAADVTLILGYFGEPGDIECFIIAILKYYFFLASFFWLVIMSSEICWTIRQSTKQLRIRKGSQRQKFLTYTVCGWLLPIPPLCMAVIVDTLDTNYLNGFPLGMIPEFGKLNCWFGQPQALLVFFGAPLALTMFLCTFSFIYSARVVYQTKSTVRKSSSSHHKAFMLYIRLALLSGITWISGLVAASVNIVALKYVVVVLNAPQGLFILLAFTFTDKVRDGLQAKFSRWRCCLFHGCCCCSDSESVCGDKSTVSRKISDSSQPSADTQTSSV
ncbi:unnamed protein product [Meganyctiphanes norvegica]|uniref:G-protein coupled receptors family 2 profile 2 domain-containing protein n=1 Tax=Meganyctiphanes norvegica TaxID=48144 RepID=A0AAV2RT22_MEGNR